MTGEKWKMNTRTFKRKSLNCVLKCGPPRQSLRKFNRVRMFKRGASGRNKNRCNLYKKSLPILSPGIVMFLLSYIKALTKRCPPIIPISMNPETLLLLVLLFFSNEMQCKCVVHIFLFISIQVQRWWRKGTWRASKPHWFLGGGIARIRGSFTIYQVKRKKKPLW